MIMLVVLELKMKKTNRVTGVFRGIRIALLRWSNGGVEDLQF
jgi:hypothetical protein